MRRYPATTTGCSATSPRTTLAIVAATSPEQLPVSLALASNVLREAASRNNTPRLALFGTSLSDARPASVRNVLLLESIANKGWSDGDLVLDGVDIVVGASDLSFLRLVPSMEYGEACEIGDLLDDASVDGTIACLLRPAPVVGDAAQLPPPWRDHARNLESFRWIEKLWKQSKHDRESGDTDGITASPRDLMSLCMYVKLSSVAMRTTTAGHAALREVVSSVEGAAEAGLLDVFGRGGVLPTFLDVIVPYLVGDEHPWQLSARGVRAAQRARAVLDKTFTHARRVADVLSHASMALVVHDEGSEIEDGAEEGIVLVHSGANGDMAKLLVDRVPVSASAEGGKLRVQFAPVEHAEWTGRLNAEFRTLVDFVRGAERPPIDPGAPNTASKDANGGSAPPLRALLGAFAALSSEYLVVDRSVHAASTPTVLSNVAKNVISTYPAGIAAHVQRQLIVRDSFLQVDSSMAHVSVQSGLSTACSFATFCASTASDLQAPAFSATDVGAYDVGTAQETIETVATALDTSPAPLGLMRGTFGGVVELDGAEHRVCYWRRGGEATDSVVTLLPKRYVDLMFADYATGARSLDPEEFVAPRMVPFFAADSIFTLFRTAAVAGSRGLAYRVPPLTRSALLERDEGKLYASFTKAIRAGTAPGVQIPVPALGDDAICLYVRESANDRLTGLRVAWARRPVAGSGGTRMLTHLVSANGEFERVAF